MGDGEAILLKDIWPIERPKDYKVHFARRWGGKYEPLNDWLQDRSKWENWQRTRPGHANMFNRPYIFSLMDFYHERDAWLFGGVWRVVKDHKTHYEVELMDLGEPFIGRLKLWGQPSRLARQNFDRHYHDLKVLEILREPFSGRKFPGYEELDVSFRELETLVRNDRLDWKAALESVKGIYLITDAKSGKQYVGSAYGDRGVWSRWSDYVNSGHGGNKEIIEWLKNRDLDYCRENFHFALLEQHRFHMLDDAIIGREWWWKRVLLSREFGLNRN